MRCLKPELRARVDRLRETLPSPVLREPEPDVSEPDDEEQQA